MENRIVNGVNLKYIGPLNEEQKKKLLDFFDTKPEGEIQIQMQVEEIRSERNYWIEEQYYNLLK